MITGKITKVEPTKEDVSITIKVGYEHYIPAANLLMKCKKEDIDVCIVISQMSLPENETSILKEILHDINSVKGMIEKKLFQNETGERPTIITMDLPDDQEVSEGDLVIFNDAAE